MLFLTVKGQHFAKISHHLLKECMLYTNDVLLCFQSGKSVGFVWKNFNHLSSFPIRQSAHFNILHKYLLLCSQDCKSVGFVLKNCNHLFTFLVRESTSLQHVA